MINQFDIRPHPLPPAHSRRRAPPTRGRPPPGMYGIASPSCWPLYRMSHSRCRAPQPRQLLAALPDVSLQEALVEVVADGVVDEALLRLGLPARLVLEHHVIVPPGGGVQGGAHSGVG